MELAIDTADAVVGLCVSRDGTVLVETVALPQATHTAELARRVEGVLTEAGVRARDVEMVAVCLGPGGYTGLRAGLSLAKGLALGLEVPLLGVPRFEAEAWPFRLCPCPVVTVHRAGRGEYAWQQFADGSAAGPPRAGTAGELLAALPPAETLIIGELDEAGGVPPGVRVLAGAAATRRPSVIAELARRRYERGERDDLVTLAPIYLREPVIGPARKGRA